MLGSHEGIWSFAIALLGVSKWVTCSVQSGLSTVGGSLLSIGVAGASFS